LDLLDVAEWDKEVLVVELRNLNGLLVTGFVQLEVLQLLVLLLEALLRALLETLLGTLLEALLRALLRTLLDALL
jgi:hypothetical protein